MRFKLSDTWVDHSKAPDPDWVEFVDAPLQLASRARYESILGVLQDLWRDTGDTRIVVLAMVWTSVHHQQMRPWLHEALTAALAQCPPEARDAAKAQIRAQFSPGDQAHVQDAFRALKLSGKPH
jgi:hypothetical protein